MIKYVAATIQIKKYDYNSLDEIKQWMNNLNQTNCICKFIALQNEYYKCKIFLPDEIFSLFLLSFDVNIESIEYETI